MRDMTVTRVSDEQLRQWAEEAEAEQANRIHQETVWADAEETAHQMGDKWALGLAFFLEEPVMDSLYGRGATRDFYRAMDEAWEMAKEGGR